MPDRAFTKAREKYVLKKQSFLGPENQAVFVVVPPSVGHRHNILLRRWIDEFVF